LLVGEGAQKSALARAAQQVEGRIHFAGFVDQQTLPSYYSAADVLVLPSGMGETWGLVVNEAMAAGLAVVVSDLCGCAPDLVREEVNGYQFPCGDVAVLRERMHWFIANRSAIRAMGDASKCISGEFSLTAAAEGFERAARESDRRELLSSRG
jgi:glycosyltransferase involved in cell wall biosynthesis